MGLLIWIGAVVALVGVAGLFYSALGALKARRAGLAEEALRKRLHRLILINFAALGVAVLGLMVVVVALLIGGRL